MFVAAGGHLNARSDGSDTEAETEEENVSQAVLIQVDLSAIRLRNHRRRIEYW